MNGDTLDFTDIEYRLIVSGSMDSGDTGYEIESIPKDSIVAIHHIGYSELIYLEQGDVVAYVNNSDQVIVHRVMSNNPDSLTLTLKGDANSLPETIAYEHVIGKVVGVSHWIGVAVTIIQSYPVLMFAGLACIIVLIVCLRDLICMVRRRSNDE